MQSQKGAYFSRKLLLSLTLHSTIRPIKLIVRFTNNAQKTFHCELRHDSTFVSAVVVVHELRFVTKSVFLFKHRETEHDSNCSII